MADFEVRAPKGAELKEIVDFLDKNLRPDQDWSIINEYPIAFHQKNLNNIRILVENGKILSHAVIKNLLVKTPMAIFKVAAIGSVVTDKDHRQKGLSSQVVQDCMKAAQEQDADFLILWTDLYDFYRNFGFELAGTEVALVVDKEMDVPTPEGLRFSKSNRVDPNAILKLYSQHSTGSMRTSSDVFSYLQIPNCQLYTAWDKNNNLLAYAVEGRGADLENYIHEWGGGVSNILPLLNEILKDKQKPITVISPSTSRNLIRQLQEKGAYTNDGFLGMIKLANTKNLFFKIKRFARYVGQEDFILEYNGEDYLVGHSSHIFRTKSEKDIVRLIFGPQKASQLHNFDVETQAILEKVFPIPMWIWGWDSV